MEFLNILQLGMRLVVDKKFISCCGGIDPSCEDGEDCADRAWKEVERLRNEEQECEWLRYKMADILHRTADALHGGPLKNGLWSWHDLPERAANERALADQLVDAVMSESVEDAVQKTDAALAAYDKARRDTNE